MRKAIESYVALGDSLSEGLGDDTFGRQRMQSGWADRFATLLALEAKSVGKELRYANLAVRGKRISDIMGEQLHKALELKPDLVTIMAGQNDLMGRRSQIPLLEQKLTDGVRALQATGCKVIIANTINPIHLAVFRPLAHRASNMTEMIERVASKTGTTLLDVNRIRSMGDLWFWAEDMVHFSGLGHILVANRAAELLQLKYRLEFSHDVEAAMKSRSVKEITKWFIVYVIPFFWRRVRGVTSGDKLQAKYSQLERQPVEHFAVEPVHHLIEV